MGLLRDLFGEKNKIVIEENPVTTYLKNQILTAKMIKELRGLEKSDERHKKCRKCGKKIKKKAKFCEYCGVKQ